MKKIITLGGSNSSKSINKTLAIYASTYLENVESLTIDLKDYILPMYDPDFEEENGIPKNATKLFNLIQCSNGIILSLAEHNGSYSAVFKNTFDWMSRINQKIWNDIPMLLMATSPGVRGGASVLKIAKNSFPYFGGNVVADFSLPSFYNNFSENKITDAILQKALETQIAIFQKSL